MSISNITWTDRRADISFTNILKAAAQRPTGTVTHLVFRATLAVSDVLSNDPLHLLPEHRILSELRQETVQ